MSAAGYRTLVKKSGPPTAFVGEATTDIGNNQFKITDRVKSAFDLDTAVTAFVDGVETTPEKIDYLFGVITFANPPAGVVTVDGSYVPLSAAGGAMEYSLNIEGDILDDTTFEGAQANGGFRTKCYGLTDVTCSVNRYDALEKFWKNLKETRQAVMIEHRPGNGLMAARGWYVVETAGNSGDVGALESESISLQLAGNADRNFSMIEIDAA